MNNKKSPAKKQGKIVIEGRKHLFWGKKYNRKQHQILKLFHTKSNKNIAYRTFIAPHYAYSPLSQQIKRGNA
jgi:hypothetical protein